MRNRCVCFGLLGTLIFISITVFPGGVSAVEEHPAISSLSSLLMTYGNCLWGYRIMDGKCQVVEIPEHAFLDSSGAFWECERGYRRASNRCIPVEVPAHAFLSYSGHDWECERGYQRTKDRCVEIKLPEHAYLDFSGHDWVCERGYKRSEDRCVPIKLPAHAHLDVTGHDWECVRGYERVNEVCQPVWAQLGTPGAQALSVALSPEVRDTVKQLQIQLKQAGYDPGPIDGILGPKTLAALQRFIEAQERALAKTSATLWACPSGLCENSSCQLECTTVASRASL
jgi:hypothetical protein